MFINQSLISVSNKKNLTLLAQALFDNNINILASDGSADYIKQYLNPKKLQYIAEYTKQPEILAGRVKTLHPKIFGGILARTDQPADILDLETFDINPIELIIINLYPFTAHVNTSNFEENLKNIDIGGTALIRAAAKNYKFKLIIVDPDDYPWLIEKLTLKAEITLEDRLQMAVKAFNHTADYEQSIAQQFNKIINLPKTLPETLPEALPEKLQLTLTKIDSLRYGENPDQIAAVYKNNTMSSKSSDYDNKQLQLIHGKALSYNNLNDSNCAIEVINNLNKSSGFNHLASCVIIKHATPCGVSSADNPQLAYQQAYSSDPKSAFGGIIALNKTLDADLADYIISNQFVEVLIVPDLSPQALEIIKLKPDLRLLKHNFNNHLLTQNQESLIKYSAINNILPDGFLVQTPMQTDNLDLIPNFTPVTIHQDIDAQIILDLKFSWYIAQQVKSNAIVISKNLQTIGIGAGQTSRIGSIELAIKLAQAHQHKLQNSVLASDGFFPFTDSIEVAHQYGIKAIIQPGGSKQDAKIIAKANELNIIMIFTHKRKFCH